MTFSTFTGTHGGIEYYARTLRAMLAAGWTGARFSYSRPDWSAASIVQSNTMPIEVALGGQALPLAFDLPVMFMTGQTVRKDFTAVTTAGIDYTLNADTGAVVILAGGAYDNGSGFGTGSFTVDRGYSIRQGWAVLSSVGGSGVEQIKVGLRFGSAVANATAPVLTGIEWSLWDHLLVSAESFTLADLAKRSLVAHDVRNFIAANSTFVGMSSITLDRIVTHVHADDELGSFAFAGGLRRFRPLSEQRLTVAAMGNTTRLADPAGGPVVKTNEPGSLATATEMGSLWDHTLNRFVNNEAVMLNANHWSREAGSFTAGYTPPVRETVAGLVDTMPSLYYEAHNVIPGRDITTVGATTNILFGLAEGLYTLLLSEPLNFGTLTVDGRTIRVAHIGARRFVGIEEL